jgi:hypothetical protein
MVKKTGNLRIYLGLCAIILSLVCLASATGCYNCIELDVPGFDWSPNGHSTDYLPVHCSSGAINCYEGHDDPGLPDYGSYRSGLLYNSNCACASDQEVTWDNSVCSANIGGMGTSYDGLTNILYTSTNSQENEPVNHSACYKCLGAQSQKGADLVENLSKGDTIAYSTLKTCNCPPTISKFKGCYVCLDYGRGCYQCLPGGTARLPSGTAYTFPAHYFVSAYVEEGNGVTTDWNLQTLTSYVGACNPRTDCSTDPNCPGDVNGDGYVDQDDLIALASFWQSSCSLESNQCCQGADLNGDGTVNLADFNIISQNMGKNCKDPSGSGL